MNINLMKTFKHSIAVGLTAAMIITVSMPATADFAQAYAETQGTSSVGLSAVYRTWEEVTQKLKEVWNLDYKAEYSREPSVTQPYSAGSLTMEKQENALAFVNAVRYIAGLSSDVELNENYETCAQAAALLNRINHKLTHYPECPEGIDDGLYDTGKLGASSSNLAVGTSDLRETIKLFMDDIGVSTLGHRRWILYPALQNTGFGMVESYSSMYVIDNFSTANAKLNPGVVWPAQNMPLELWNTGNLWSASFGRQLNVESVTVDISKNNGQKSWSITSSGGDGTLAISNSNYGQPGCVMFKPDSPSYKNGDTYHITIKENGVIIADYEVNFFNVFGNTGSDYDNGGNDYDGNDYGGNDYDGNEYGDNDYVDNEYNNAKPEDIAAMQKQKVTNLEYDKEKSCYWQDYFQLYFKWTPTEEYTTDMYDCYVNGKDVGYTSDDDYEEGENKYYYYVDSEIDNLKRGRGYIISVQPNYWVDKKHVLGEKTSIKIATRPYKVTGVTVKSSSGKAKISWGKKTGSGYQVQIATNSKFTKNKKIYKLTSSDTLKKTVSGLKSGRKYYVRVRAYKTYGNTAYGSWSKTVTFICK